MRWSLLLLVLCVVALGPATQTVSGGAAPAGVAQTYSDTLIMGDAASEAAHNLQGWGEISTSESRRSVRFQTVRADNAITFSNVPRGLDYRLTAEIFDGFCDDSFQIVVNGVVLLDFQSRASLQDLIHVATLPADLVTSNSVTVVFRNKAKDDCGRASTYNVTLTSSERRCFPETGKCLQGPFLAYWQANGGLPVNGYPLSGEFVEMLEDGKPYYVQYFERVRMEHHPRNRPPFDVLLGQFGRRIHPADPPVAPASGATFFPETGHNVPPDFLAFWRANGGLAQFGLPISEVFRETLEDGKSYEVQYFERARFERHPENSAPNQILLGQFGRRILGNR